MNNWSSKNIQEKGLMQGDMVLWMILILLCLISVVSVYSASSNMTYSTGEYWAPVMRHGCFLLTGVGFTWILHMLPCKFYKILGLAIMFLSYVLLICALFAGRINGASRWIGVGSFSFQPSEIAKLGLVITTAFIFSVFRDKNGVSPFGLKLAVANIGLTMLLIVTENLSTAALIAVVMFMMCFYAQVSSKVLIWTVAIVVALVTSGITAAYSIPDSKLQEWRESDGILHRVPVWVARIKNKRVLPRDPNKYNITEDIQVTHAEIAIATCRVVGLGPGNSVERDYLPQAFSDFIYAILIEEWGIEGGILVMLLYLGLLYRAMQIAKRCKARFPAYLIMGISLMLVTQAMINMAVAVGAMPVTGQQLPLISRGGTGTFVNCAYLGIMLSVSRSAKKIEENKPEKPENAKTES